MELETEEKLLEELTAIREEINTNKEAQYGMGLFHELFDILAECTLYRNMDQHHPVRKALREIVDALGFDPSWRICALIRMEEVVECSYNDDGMREYVMKDGVTLTLPPDSFRTKNILTLYEYMNTHNLHPYADVAIEAAYYVRSQAVDKWVDLCERNGWIEKETHE